MTMPPGNVTIVVRNAPLLRDERHGNLKRDWDAAVSTAISGCWVQPISGEEAVLDREFSRTNLRLFAPHSDALLVTSRVDVDGVEYEVNGEPRRWPGPGGAPHHIEADLKRLTG